MKLFIGGDRVVVLFGSGLVGSAIAAALQRERQLELRSHALNWDAVSEPVLESAARAVEAALAAAPGVPIELIWAAGVTGFSATEAQIEVELETFRATTRAMARVVAAQRGTPAGFILVSSAGGLFEGQRVVRRESAPTPQSPYARLKSQQEAIASGPGLPWQARVVRASSIYGPIRPGHRLGLVSAMIANGLRQRPTRITARMDTLRDFVWVEDVARYVVRIALDEATAAALAEPVVLAAARPTSLAEVQRIVSGIFGRQLYVSYAARANDVDITFHPDAVAPGFVASELRANAIIVHRDALERGLRWGAAA